MASSTTINAADFWNRIDQIKIAMVTTRDGDVLRSRPMFAFADEEKNRIWFFTKASDHKTVEVEAMGDVNLSFADKDHSCFISASGDSQVIDDRQVAENFWRPEVAAWFSEGLDDPDMRLIAVTVTQAEIWTRDEGPIRLALELAKGVVSSEDPDLGENQKLRFVS